MQCTLCLTPRKHKLQMRSLCAHLQFLCGLSMARPDQIGCARNGETVKVTCDLTMPVCSSALIVNFRSTV
jgi:hypothetical protein